MNAPIDTGRPATTRKRFHAWGELAIVVAAFGILTVFLIAPMALHLGSVGRLDNADTRMLIWNVAWVARTLIVDPLHVLDANIFYPHRGTLVYSESNLGAGVLAIPVYWATRNPYAAHNFVVLLTFVLSGTATSISRSILVRRSARSRGLGDLFRVLPLRVLASSPHPPADDGRPAPEHARLSPAGRSSDRVARSGARPRPGRSGAVLRLLHRLRRTHRRVRRARRPRDTASLDGRALLGVHRRGRSRRDRGSHC